MTKINQTILIVAAAIAGLAVIALIWWAAAFGANLGAEREADFREACTAAGGVPSPNIEFGYDRCQYVIEHIEQE